MKLLFDENLSPKLPRLLADLFPGGTHVRDCGLKGLADKPKLTLPAPKVTPKVFQRNQGLGSTPFPG